MTLAPLTDNSLNMKQGRLKNILLAISVIYAPSIDLPRLNIDPKTVTVSGVSSGAFMAEQMLVAASDVIIGAGVISGGVYGCAQGNVNMAVGTCMQRPQDISVQSLIKQALVLEKQGLISPLSHLQNRRIFILNGLSDTVINPQAGLKLLNWSQNFMPADHIATEFSLPMSHGIPTKNFGNSCSQEGSPWINNCAYDGAQNILEYLLDKSLKNGVADLKHLIKFNQIPFITENSTMHIDGYAYIPAVCRLKNKSCDLHIALHGCFQTPDDIEDTFLTQAGYNNWGEANGIVILYPVVARSFFNSKSCWDWWGYTGSNYLTREAPQIQSLLKMIQHLTGQKN